jgi:beta-1,4-mannosyltransferase
MADVHRPLVNTVMSWPALRTDNPYHRQLFGTMAAAGTQIEEWSPRRLLRTPPAVLHLHWPEIAIQVRNPLRALARAVALTGLVRRAGSGGCRIVWTVHNLHGHETPHPRLERWLWRALLPSLDGYIALSEGGAAAAVEAFPVLRRCAGFVIPSGHYRGVYADTVTREEARSRLGLPVSSPVYAFIGKVRPYKNVPHLIRSFRNLDDPRPRLVVAGLPDSAEMGAQVRGAAEGDDRVRLTLVHVPDDDLQLYFRAADVVVLPFTDILNSSSALVALAFDRPVVVPRLGAMSELQAAAGGEWVRTYDGDLTVATLKDAMDWAQINRGPCTTLDHLAWPEIAWRTMDAYRDLVGRRRA